MLILLLGTVHLLVFIAAFMGEDFVSSTLVFCGIYCDHFRSGDHLRTNLEIICGEGIICGPVQAPFLSLSVSRSPITWSLYLPYKPLESTLSDEKLFIVFVQNLSRPNA